MKKLFFSLAALFGCTLSVSAQKAAMLEGRMQTIPSYFTYNHTPYITTLQEDDDNIINIYDMSFNQISSFNLGKEDFDNFELKTIIDKNGVSFDVEFDDIYLTQTFFNDDADWEYIVPVKGGEPNEWGYFYTESYTIKKTDGTVVGSIPADKYIDEVWVINDVVYALTSEYDESTDKTNYYYYTVSEYRKFMSHDASGVKPVPAMVRTVSNETRDLMGRKVSDRHKGIVIKDGRKSVAR